MNLPGRHLLFSGRVAKSLNRLANLPLGRSHELPNGKHAWGMYAERNTDRPPQFGVYSTGFAIELLARLPSSGDASVLQAIEGGIAFLMSQYAEHHEVSGGRMMDSKQGRKLREVGHTDFASVLKHTVALDAFACLTRLKDIDRRYNLLLQSVEAVAEQMRHDLAGFARSTEHPVSRERYTGWPWHNIAGAAAGDPLDPIPTAHAYRALLLPLFRGKADLVPPAEIRRYLRSILTDQHVRPLEKAVRQRGMRCITTRYPLRENDRITSPGYGSALGSSSLKPISRWRQKICRSKSWGRVMRSFAPSNGTARSEQVLLDRLPFRRHGAPRDS